jgi:hypothetical protein
MEFYIKWKGWTEVENTWIPAEDLNCPIIMKKYLKLNPFAGNPDTLPLITPLYNTKSPKSLTKHQTLKGKQKLEPEVPVKKSHAKRHSWTYEDATVPASKAFPIYAPEPLPQKKDMLLGNFHIKKIRY